MSATLKANGITLAYEIEGEEHAPCVLLIMGLGMQLVAWPDPFRHALLQAGFRVLRFDNRDAGLSSHLRGVHSPSLLWSAIKHRFGLRVRAPYTLRDMVDDTAALLAALAIERVHVVGVSMGGMIAQGLAAHYPQRVASLTSIMSTSGARYLPQARPEIARALLSRPDDPRDREAVVTHLMNVLRLIGSPAFPIDDLDLRLRVSRAVERSYDPAGTARQMLAIIASGDRSAELAMIRCPTLVVHGKDDPLVPVACGEDTARKIVGARFHAIHGMGHDLPPGVVKLLIEQLVPFLKSARI